MTTIKPEVQRAINEIKTFCAATGGRSQYFRFGAEEYKSSVRHFLESSAEIAAGAVQPGSADDVAEILNIIARHKADFAVKGGGHATNPRFSSTTGIQISLSRLNKIHLEIRTTSLSSTRKNDLTNSIVHIGAGCLFDEVYRELAPHGLNIVGGGSIAGVGVAGWLLGGGYSFKTNQYGLGIDNIVEMEVVLPSKEAVLSGDQVVHPRVDARKVRVGVLSEGNDKVLFEALKGGGNNFGIVTEFTLRTHRQGRACGCLLQYKVEDEEVKTALVDFAQQTNPKASLVAAFRYYNNPGGIQSMLTVQCFYDGPRPENNGPFADLFRIDATSVPGGGDTVGMVSTPLFVSMPMELGLTRPLLKPIATQVGYRPNQSELVEYNDYQQFDSRMSSINETLDRMGIPVEETQLPLSSTYSDIKDHTSNMLNLSTTHGGGRGTPFKTLVRPPRNTIKRAMAGVGENPRGRWGNVMIDVYTEEIIEEIRHQASEAAEKMLDDKGGKSVVFDIWPFTKGMFDDATNSAWPHVKDKPNGPAMAFFTWEGAENDDFWVDAMETALTAIKDKVDEVRGAEAEPLPVYMNTALYTGTAQVEEIYGDHLEWLKAAREKYDPDGVMNLTGGFRIPDSTEDDDT